MMSHSTEHPIQSAGLGLPDQLLMKIHASPAEPRM